MSRTKMVGVAAAAVVLTFSTGAAASLAPTAVQHDRPAGPAISYPDPSFTTSHARRFAVGHVLVVPVPGTGAGGLDRVHSRLGARVDRVLPGTTVREVHLPPGLSVAEAVRRYERSADVAYAEPDFLVRPAAEPLSPNDPDFPSLFGLDNTGQTGGTPDADIDAPEAWGETTGSAGTVVAVIDTGVDVGHVDLADNIWANPGETPGNGVDDDGNGYVDDVHGWDFHHDDNTVFDGSGDEHGTHVAGTIAATGGNGTGVTGVSWRASVMPLKFLGADGGYTSDAIAALDYAVANGAMISNNSWGGAGYSQSLEDAIERAGARGHLVVAAAGNGGDDGIGDDNDAHPVFPASYDSDNLVAVAATDHDDVLAGFSNYGATSVDLAAPGVGILSTLPHDAYGRYSGTSMAAPHVSGAAALLLSEDPQLGHESLERKLLDGVDAKPTLAATVLTGGRLNLAGALGASADPALSLAGTPATVRFGSATTLGGQLTVDGQPLAGQPVAIQHRRVGTVRWRPQVEGGELTTGPDGSFSLPGVRPVGNTDYRARYAGSSVDGLTPATSTPRRTHVRARVSLRVSPTELRIGRSRTVSGTIRPVHAGDVRVVVARNGTVVKRRSMALTDSRYRFRYEPPRRGRYTFFTVHPADPDHLGGRSPTKAFRVIR